jgi:hypothetical protein
MLAKLALTSTVRIEWQALALPISFDLASGLSKWCSVAAMLLNEE